MSKAKDPYSAIADPTRRAILEVLRDRGSMTAGQIAGLFPGVSRPAVSKHLRVLREGSLVRSRERGRERLYRIDPERLADVEAWLQGFAPLWEASLRRLKERIEEGNRPAQD